MPELHDLLEGAVDRPDPLDLDGLRARVAGRHRRRRLANLAAVAVIVVAFGAAAVARGTGSGDEENPLPPAGEETTPSQPEGTPTTVESTTTTTSSTTSSTTAGGTGGQEATVPGGPGGTPPCAEPGAGQEQATVEHPERAPFQAEESFDDDVHWAICGADPAFSSELLNLRSVDGGATWSVTDTGLDMTPFHAGDLVEVDLTSPTTGTIRLVSLVGEWDDLYETADGGATWRPTS